VGIAPRAETRRTAAAPGNPRDDQLSFVPGARGRAVVARSPAAAATRRSAATHGLDHQPASRSDAVLPVLASGCLYASETIRSGGGQSLQFAASARRQDSAQRRFSRLATGALSSRRAETARRYTPLGPSRSPARRHRRRGAPAWSAGRPSRRLGDE